LNNRIFFVCLVLFSLCSIVPLSFGQTLTNSKKDYIKPVSEKAGELVYSFSFDQPRIEDVSVNGGVLKRLSAPYFDYIQEEGFPILPKINYLLELPEGSPQATIVENIKENIPVTSPLSFTGGFSDASADPKKKKLRSSEWYPQTAAELTYMGKMREIPLYRLTLYPYRYHADKGLVEFSKKMVVKIIYSTTAKVRVYESNTSEVNRILNSELLNAKPAVRSRFLKSKNSDAQTLSKVTALSDALPVKIVVNKSGIYKITYDYLRDKTGLNLSNIDPRTIRLFNLGHEVPIYFRVQKEGAFQSGDFFEFYGEQYLAKFNPYLKDIPSNKAHYLDPWSEDNVYFLSWGSKPGLRLIEENGGIVIPKKSDSLSANQFLVTKHFEQDKIHLKSIKNINLIQPSAVEDIWTFDEGISSLLSTRSQKDYEFTIDRLSSSSVGQSLRINLQGISTNDHTVDIKINGIGITTSLHWSGQNKFQATIPIESLLSNPLNEGINTLTISTPVSSNQLDAFALNWFEITYKRKYQATDNYIEFIPSEESVTTLNEFRIEKFGDPDISVYKKGISRIVNWDLKTVTGARKDTSYFIVFQDEINIDGIEYVAVSESAKLLPKDISLDKPSALINGSHNARYLIIAHDSLKNAAKRLENYRRSKGFTVETVDVQDIYDEFNFGIKSPYAIRDFLRHTYHSINWQGSQGSPLYVVLIGDASANSKSITIKEMIPTQFIQTQAYGPAASDYWYALADDNDILPDFFIGRIPAANASQLDAVIDKIITYEQFNEPGSWKNKVLFIGGQSDTRGVINNNTGNIPVDVFRFQCNNIINSRMRQSFTPDRIFVFPIHDQFYGNSSQVIRGFEDGNLITAYLGHGGGGIWGDVDSVSGKPLMNITQANALKTNGGRYPIVLSMTCFVGDFVNQSSLGEILLYRPYAGAIGVVAASGTGWIIGDYQLLDNSINAFLIPGNTVGEAMTQGKINYLLGQGITDYEVGGGGNLLTSSFVPQSMVFQFNYLGDPALRLKTPQQRSFTLSNYSPSKTGSFTVSGSADFTSGSGYAEIYQLHPVKDSVINGGNKPTFVNLDTINFLISGGSYSFNINLSSIPSSQLNDGVTGIRIFGESTDGRYSFNGQENFSINGAYVSQLKTLPASPTSSDTVRFSAVASDPDGVQSVTVTYNRIGVFSETVTATLHPEQDNTYISIGVGPFSENDLVRYWLTIKDNLGDSTVSEVKEFRILAGLDLRLSQVQNPGDPTNAISIGGTSQAGINVVIQNYGYASISGVKVRFYNGNPLTSGVFLGETEFNIEGSVPNAGKIAAATATIPSTLTQGDHYLYAWLDPDSLTPDINRANNLGFSVLSPNTFNVTPSRGTTFSGIKNDTVTIDNAFFVNIPENGVGENAVVSISHRANPVINDQPDLAFAYPKGYGSAQSYSVAFHGALINSKKMMVRFEYDTLLYPTDNYYQDSLNIYKWDASNRKWNVILNGKLTQKGIISAFVSDKSEIGIYTLMINRDRLAPNIEPTIEGQYFSQGSIAPKNPKISAILYDRNGVSLDRKNYIIRLNDKPLDSSKIILPDSLPNSNTVTMMILTDQTFDVGLNHITFQVSDVNGNMSDPDTLKFKVVSGFDIKVMGNFPNPFSNVTTFAFRIEAPEPLDDLNISIYTVSGRRIKKITPDDITSQALNSVGYHEVQWDATDDDGRNIANGIYFYRIRGKLNGKSVEKKGKIAYFR
jgi:hypothetical protein